METVKGYRAARLTKDEGRREVCGMVSTIDVDLIGDVMMPNGADFGNMNPGVTIHHDDQKIIGTHRRHQVKADGVWVRLQVGDWPEADAVWKMVQAGALGAMSIEFTGIDYGPPTAGEAKSYEGARRVFRKWSLDGYSLVRRPCNPKALISETKAAVSDFLLTEVRAGRIDRGVAARLGMTGEAAGTLVLGRLTWKIAG